MINDLFERNVKIMHVVGNQVRNNYNIQIAAARENGEVVRYTTARIPIYMLYEIGANEQEIERAREADRLYRRSQRAIREGNTIDNFYVDRTFGIELEMFHSTNINIASDVGKKLNELGIKCIDQHNINKLRDSETSWTLAYDGSIRGRYAFELVSPILKGTEAFETIKKVCEVLKEFGCEINHSCGFHVHHFAKDLSPQRIRECFNFYKKNETLIDSVMPTNRHNNRYCHSVDVSYDSWKCSRYFKLNYQSLAIHNTIEFRQHNGTLDINEIINWIKLTQLFLLKGRSNKKHSSLDELLKTLNFSNPDFYLFRAKKVAA